MTAVHTVRANRTTAQASLACRAHLLPECVKLPRLAHAGASRGVPVGQAPAGPQAGSGTAAHTAEALAASGTESLHGVALVSRHTLTELTGAAVKPEVMRAQPALIHAASPLLHPVVNVLALIPSHALILCKAGLACREGRGGHEVL